MILSDQSLKQIQPVSPFLPYKDKSGVSFGLSHAGYDIRAADEWKMITEASKAKYREKYGRAPILDPKMPEEEQKVLFEEFCAPYVVIPPHGFVLTRSIEYFEVPRNILVICLGKSTYARLGLVVNTTPFEPEWRGFPTLELSNTTDLPLKVYAGEGIAQCLFVALDRDSENPYEGKYQDQGAEIVHARI